MTVTVPQIVLAALIAVFVGIGIGVLIARIMRKFLDKIYKDDD